MPSAVFSENSRTASSVRQPHELAISAIVTPCSALKSVAVESRSRAVSLASAPQSVVETAWRQRLAELPATLLAGDLYRGRGFMAARRAAERAEAAIFIASAGLGLVRGDLKIPGYGLTVAGDEGPDAIRARVMGRFEPASWWRALQAGPYSTDLDQVFFGNGLVVMALTHAYADLLVEELAALDEDRLARLRIVGTGLASRLPVRVRCASLLPYDGRLDRHVPGVRGEFSQRALVHFVEMLLNERAACSRAGDIGSHRALVEATLGHAPIEVPPHRSRATDAIISQRISARLSSNPRKLPGASVLLRAIRNDDGIACEASRFMRLYRLAAGIASKDARRS